MLNLEEQREKFHLHSIRRSVFLAQSCPFFEPLTRFIHKTTLLVAIFGVPGCVYTLESVFFLNVVVFGVSDSLGERIHMFSVANVEHYF